jgi:hypothetical protein
MIFFRLRESIDTKIIGRKYPQVKDVAIPTTWNDPMFIDSFFARKAPTNVLLPTPMIWKRTIITDLLSGGSIGLTRKLLVSEKLANILQEGQIHGIQFFDVTVLTETNENLKFSLVHPFDFLFQNIDFENSEIGYYSLSVFDREPKRVTEIRNAKDMFNEVDKFEKSITNGNYEPYSLHIEKISLLNDASIDFFSLGYVSAGCTGIVFTEPNEKYP